MAAGTAPVRVFAAGDAGVACYRNFLRYRIPAVVRTANGTLLAFAEARHGQGLGILKSKIRIGNSSNDSSESSQFPSPGRGSCGDGAVQQLAVS
eukprot:gene56742-biopygen38110